MGTRPSTTQPAPVVSNPRPPAPRLPRPPSPRERRRSPGGGQGRIVEKPEMAGAADSARSSSHRRLAEVQRRVARVHRRADPEEQLRFYEGWAPEYEEDVAVLQYQAPQLAAACLASIFQGPLQEALVLDVACGTGLVAQELQVKGFRHLHGLDGSQAMLEHARCKGLYQDLKRCLLGQEALPAAEGCYDAVLIVGALSEGQVPTSVVPELLRVTKAGGYVCLTTRSNLSNLEYKAKLHQVLDQLEEQGLWRKVTEQDVEKWERATSEQESAQGLDYISGVVYLYQKNPVPVL
ncbi:methyltransferase-like protein 27 [Rhineura floridana]|uniref:methyltransferase-like protein 27 n=1 Tax=Rhineura floridana TaxID=261503 RepID=UPI002AC8859E|nr:methyltransferase-like protein 27 [Rhineura floridana]